MKIKSDFALRQVAETWIALPLAEETVNMSGMLTLNETGVMLWRLLEKGCDQQTLVNALTEEYEVSAQQAQADITEFLSTLNQLGCLEAD